MLTKRYKTIYETITEIDDDGNEIERRIPKNVVLFYLDGVEITEDEYESILEKLPKPKEHTQDEIDRMLRIDELKRKLDESDFKAIKYAEGIYTEKEYAPIKAERQKLRDEINALEK